MRWIVYTLNRAFRSRKALIAVCVTGLAPCAARPAAAAGDGMGGYQVIRLESGHYNRLYAPVSIEGTTGTMLISTASIHSVVSREKFHSLTTHEGQNLPPNVPATEDIYERRFPVALAQAFHVGAVNLGPVPVALEPGYRLYDRQMLYKPGSDHQYDGILCADILRHYHAIIDCGRGAMYISPDPTRKLNLGSAFTQAGWTRVPMSDFGNRFAVPCVVDGHRFRLLVSTNTPYTLLDYDQLELAKISPPEDTRNDTRLTSRFVHYHALLYGNIQVGDYLAVDSQCLTSKNVTANTDRTIEREEHMTPGAPILGFLSGNFLAHNAAVIDLDDHALYLKRSSAAKPQ